MDLHTLHFSSSHPSVSFSWRCGIHIWWNIYDNGILVSIRGVLRDLLQPPPVSRISAVVVAVAASLAVGQNGPRLPLQAHLLESSVFEQQLPASVQICQRSAVQYSNSAEQQLPASVQIRQRSAVQYSNSAEQQLPASVQICQRSAVRNQSEDIVSTYEPKECSLIYR
eukprot:1194913-Prorocentrum_minimum.AAC.2